MSTIVTSKSIPDNLAAAMTSYLQHIRDNYAAWGSATLSDPDPIKAQVRADMIARFNEGLTVDAGSKYLKVIADRSAHTFIVLKADGKFAAGDILKAASWAAPARNFARGNILRGDWSNTTWTGAH